MKRPLYSHLLSLIAFFSIAFFYTGVGAHHLLQSPVPEWLKTIAIIMSVLMLVPVLTFATNIILTMRGSWHRLIGNPSLQFIVVAFFAYILTSLQGSLQSSRVFNAWEHFSQWTPGHAHLALLAGFGFLVIGITYYLIPRVLGFQMYSRSLTRLSFWLALFGFIFFFLSMTILGIQASGNWWVHINPVQTLPALRVMYIIRAMSGGVIVVAAIIFAFNVLMTFMRRREAHVEEAVELIEGRTEKRHSLFLRRSQEAINVPIIIGGGMAVFVLMTFTVVAMPYMYTSGEEEPTLRAHELTTTEYQGQELYKNLGCVYCHSQFVRPQDWAMGEDSILGDFYYSIPNFLGTERTGPSLGQIGGMRPYEWLDEHYIDPRSVSPSSIMPPFQFLSDTQRQELVSYVYTLGSTNLETLDFQPAVPAEYRGKTNPNDSLVNEVASSYNFTTQDYTGGTQAADEWTALFEEAKALYAQKCLSCHGCSGNGQGPYARNTVERPANLFERISHYPQPPDDFHLWRVSAGVPGTRMPPWGWSQSEDTIFKINTYENTFVTGAIRTVPPEVSAQAAYDFAKTASFGTAPPITGTQEDYLIGQDLYNLYCAQCHGQSGEGDGPASGLVKGGYINPTPYNLVTAGTVMSQYGEYWYYVMNGVATTNMAPWNSVLNDQEIARVIFYIQGFSPVKEYNQNWAPLYTDDFARSLKE